ncbi:putative permease YjgP/YjgQ family protein [Rosistilla carotiformis]|uniref:Putative permease YjgP/YjgQ family protein n=1 Tax=Rosistilla carotiformis TaxID=2528017 RepID=A0A518JYN9_9BACT|nr:LptF/LptG family permease [Rosistilla carotiformis]QDV70654.1 putative permease YjgP/YjgQ family protein [Rosistilla carotiformis]
MPTRLTRYILWEITKVFLVAIVSLTVLILLIVVARELLRQGLGPAALLQLLPLFLPLSLQFALPTTALFAVSAVYGRISADGEIATVKAAGISPLTIMKPAFIFGLILSPIAVGLNDLAVGWGKPGVKHVLLHSLEEIVYRRLQAQRSYSSDKGFSIHVQDVKDRRLLWPTVTLHSSGSELPITVTASEGSLHLNAERETLMLRLVDSRIEGGGAFRSHFPGEIVPEIPLNKAFAKGDPSSSRPADLPLYLIGPEAIRSEKAMSIDRQRLAAQTGFALANGRWNDIVGPPGADLRGAIGGGADRLNRLHVEPWRRWSFGFSCFFFVLVGAPLAIMARTADYWTSFGMVFLPILIFYFPIFIVGQDYAKNGELPPYSVWMANSVVAIVAVFMIKRVWRY